MKINDYLLALATAAYSYLFYDQNAGINFLVFTILFLAMTLYRDPQLRSDRKWQWGAMMCLLSSVGILVHSSGLAIFSNCISLLLVSAFSFRRQTSAAFSFLFSCYSLVISAAVIVDSMMRPSVKTESKSYDVMYKIVGACIVFALSVLFLSLYRLSNPLFAVNTAWVNLKFISFSWVVFTLGGFLIVYGLYYHRTVSFIESWENNLPLVNLPGEKGPSVKLDTERTGGMVLFALLNIMLFFLNVGDIRTLWLGTQLPEGMNHSDFVHNGVATIIFSIIVATGLIMFLFRKDFMSQKNSGILKILVCLWILQTFVMLISTASRNQMYIQQFSLTDLRIGVYVWLILSVIGLALTTDKILRERSNWFLIKNNIAVWFTILSFSCLLNWDVVITRYNITHQPIESVDFKYLFSLSHSNIPELIAITKTPEFEKIKNTSLNKYTFENYNSCLHKKISDYLSDYTNDWQSWDFRDKRITTSILNN